jgi:multiple sugar transport system substrate-binding protein
MSEKKKVNRRGFMKYVAVGIAAVAVAGTGAYYATRPRPSPTPTPTIKPTPTTTTTTTTTKTTPGTTIAGEYVPSRKYEGETITLLRHKSATSNWHEGDGVKEFTKLTGINVQFDIMPYASLYEKIQTALLGGADLDLVLHNAFLGPDFHTYYTPMDELFAEFGEFPYFKDFFQTDIDTLTMAYGGELKSLPDRRQTHFIFYRQDLIDDSKNQKAFEDKFGYELAPVDTYEQLRDHAEFFTYPDSSLPGGQMFGTAMPFGKVGGWAQFENFLWAYGGKMLKKTGTYEPGMLDFKNEAGYKAMKLYKELYKHCPTDAINWHWGECATHMLQGLNAVRADGVWNTGPQWDDPEKSKVVGKINFVQTPKVVKRRPWLENYGWAIPKNSKHKGAAYEHLKWLLNFDNQVLGTTSLGSFSCRKSVYKAPEIEGLRWTQATVDNFNNPDGVPQTMAEYWREVRDGGVQEIHDMLLGKQTPEQAVDNAYEKLDKLLTEREALIYTIY